MTDIIFNEINHSAKKKIIGENILKTIQSKLKLKEFLANSLQIPGVPKKCPDHILCQ